MIFNLSINNYESDLDTNADSALISKSVSSTVIECKAINKNKAPSSLLFPAAPSAILASMDTTVLPIVETNPNIYSGKNFSVIEYMSLTDSKLLIHAFRFMCGFIALTCYI